jgi:ABC-type sulfate transport system substrate-binding protein
LPSSAVSLVNRSPVSCMPSPESPGEPDDDRPSSPTSRRPSDGKGVTFETSYGASGDQSRAVELGGLKADIVHLSLEPDVSLVDAGRCHKNWKKTPTKGILTQSVVVIAVRKGNPKNIHGWDDLVKPGRQDHHPEPGLLRLGEVEHPRGLRPRARQRRHGRHAKAYLTKFFDNVAALPGSGRDATTAFTSGNGDVLLSYENEAILARQSGADFDYIVPDQTLLIQNPGAVTKDASPRPRSS